MVTRGPADQLIVIVGPTASGKSDLAVKVAKALDGEIISADSRTIYKGLDIGTAKPTIAERQGIPHYGFDLVEPDESFSAAKFQRMAKSWINDIQARGKVPIMVGGTGLYVDSILFDYQFSPAANPEFRAQLSQMSIEQLWRYCNDDNIELPENRKNKRYVIRAIEQNGINVSRKRSIKHNVTVVGIAPINETITTRVHKRALRILDSNVVEEATKAAKKYGWEAPGLSGNVYPIVRRLVDGEISKEEAVNQSTIIDRKLAKRQLTWFRRNSYIKWFESTDEAYTFIYQTYSKMN